MIKLTFSGDIMLDGSMINLYKNKNGFDFNNMFIDIKNFLNQSDYVVGNLETPITMIYNKIRNEKYRFTSPIEFAEALKNNGFNFVTTANNHCLDNGINGVKETIDSLNKIGLKHTGIFWKKDSISYININNYKIAILSYTYGTNAFNNKIYIKGDNNVRINLLQEQELNKYFDRLLYFKQNLFWKVIRKIFTILGLFQLKKPIYERIEKSSIQKEKLKLDIKEAKNNDADFIVMCIHEGGQYNEKPIKKAIKNAKYIEKLGVDLIVENHEHIIQEIEKKDKKLIAYCLGNFIGIAGVKEEPFNKMADYSILLHVYINENNVKLSNKYSFTIVKTINDNKTKNGIKVKLLYDLINECTDEKEKNRLMIDNKIIVKKFINKDIDVTDIRKEYDIV